jgi:hypothetical protein
VIIKYIHSPKQEKIVAMPPELVDFPWNVRWLDYCNHHPLADRFEFRAVVRNKKSILFLTGALDLFARHKPGILGAKMPHPAHQ